MDLRWKFNEVPAVYDKWRPAYVPALYDDIAAYAGIGQRSRLLEVGIGTGQATLPFLQRGCVVTAVELGGELAAFTREKFRPYSNFTIQNTAFEDYDAADGSFDAVYSASAFHWIPEAIGYAKVYRLLKAGGTFARFANHPYKDKGNEPLHLAIQRVYEAYLPGAVLSPEYSQDRAADRAAIAGKYGFADVTYKLYRRVRRFDAQSYAQLISTYSDHRALGREKLAAFAGEIAAVIDSFGGVINIYDTIDLQLARKP
ncbi:MAG: class I SAM-dependent methyltransferase [Eubacteriales bacterium]|nr:class I SAM-dependent methyltransferase [Eubacteriales bacterium]